MIISRDNDKVKWMRSLHDGKIQRHEGCFLLEGIILIGDALDAGHQPRLVLYDGAALQRTRRGRHLLERLRNVPCEEVSSAVFRSMTETVTPQGVVAAFVVPSVPAVLPPDGLVIVLDGVRDPGNVGAILRSAEAGGCAAVVATSDTVNLFSPKVVRAAMGAHFHLPLVYDMAWSQLPQLLEGRAVYLAEPGRGVAYYSVDWTKPAALVIGNETEGPRPEAQHSATGRVSIPMPGHMESLNTAIAASIIIFEAVRQRRTSEGA